jgi:hypothetical protein
MNVALYPVPEICQMTRLHTVSANPEQWLVREIKKGRFRARRIGRQWAMTESDIEYMLDQLAISTAEPPPVEEPDLTAVAMPSIASMRRRRSA